MKSPDPIQRRKLYQDVLDRLLLRINSGEIRPGENLPSERELMEQYGVGRPAVREAVQSLSHAGIVEILHGEGAKVVVPTARNLIDQIASGARHLLHVQPGMLEHLKEARIFLESGTARLAAQHATAADVKLLRQRIEDQRAAMAHVDRFLACDMSFHSDLARIGGNPIYPAIVEAIFQWASDYYQPMVRVPGAELLTLTEHTAVVDAIAARDPEAAERAVRAHIGRSNDLYMRLVKDCAGGS